MLLLVRNLYKSCMDEEHIESSSLSEAKDILTQLGGWPVLLGDTWAGQQNFTWHHLVEKANGLGLSSDKIINAGENTFLKRMLTIITVLRQNICDLSMRVINTEEILKAYILYVIMTIVFNCIHSSYSRFKNQ